MEENIVPARDTCVTSPKLDTVAGEMGALVLIGRFTLAS
jgi:hypothetical protein